MFQSLPRAGTKRIVMLAPALRSWPLPFFPEDWRLALRDTTAVVVGLTLACLVLDVVVFRSSLPAAYVASYQLPAWPRTLLTCFASAREELIYRLVLTTALVVLVTAGRKPDDRSAPWLAFIAAQAVLVWPSVLAWPLWASLRFWAVGSVWGWLYWRRGFVAALLGHASIHLALDPLLLITLRGA